MPEIGKYKMLCSGVWLGSGEQEKGRTVRGVTMLFLKLSEEMLTKPFKIHAWRPARERDESMRYD